MRKPGIFFLMIALALSLTGCRVSGEVEHQAYVLVLGLDREPTGALSLTAKVPRIGKNGGDSGDSGGYLVFSGSGDGWSQALESLEQATPRQMNLSHIELIVASDTLAREDGFAALVTRVAETPHLYTTARFVVCDGRASDFIDSQETVIGTRLSSEIDAMLGHYAERGYVPSASFADACYAMNSIYGDPVAIRGSTADGVQPAAVLTEPGQIGGADSPMKQRYSGTVLFREGRMAGTLSPAQTVLMNLIRGGRISIPIECDGKRYALTPEGTARRSVDILNGRATLRVSLRFATPDDLCKADARTLEAAIAADMADVIRACQALGSDPFGFAEAAAVHFPSIRAWERYDWRSRYADAEVSTEVSIRATGRG